MNTFSEILKKLREENGLTQSQLAEKLNTDSNKVLPQNISYWEKGRQPSFEILNRIADIFNVSNDYLTGRSEFKTKTEEFKLTKINQLLNEVPINLPKTCKKDLLNLLNELVLSSNFLYQYDPKIMADFYYTIKNVIDLYKSLVDFIEKQDPISMELFLRGMKGKSNYYPENNTSIEILDMVRKQIEASIRYSQYLALIKKCPQLFESEDIKK